MNQPMAYIHPDAKIGKDVVIDPFTNIQGNVEIGDGTWVGSNVTIMDGTRIGKNCKIFPGAVVGAIPQDLKFEGEKTTAIIGDNTTVREFVTINRGTKASGSTRVGSNCLIMAYVHIAHDCIVGDYVVLANAVTLAGHVEVDDWAVLGGTSAVHQFTKIGKHVMVRGGTLVGRDIPPFVTAAREPVSYAGVNAVGIKRRGYDEKQVEYIQNMYRILFQSGMNVSQAVETIKTDLPDTSERKDFLDFIERSNRGIIKGYSTIKSKGGSEE